MAVDLLVAGDRVVPHHAPTVAVAVAHVAGPGEGVVLDKEVVGPTDGVCGLPGVGRPTRDDQFHVARVAGDAVVVHEPVRPGVEEVPVIARGAVNVRHVRDAKPILRRRERRAAAPRGRLDREATHGHRCAQSDRRIGIRSGGFRHRDRGDALTGSTHGDRLVHVDVRATRAPGAGASWDQHRVARRRGGDGVGDVCLRARRGNHGIWYDRGCARPAGLRGCHCREQQARKARRYN